MSICQTPTAVIIGAGRVGKTFGRLFIKHKCLTILAICNRSNESAKCAADFIGEGLPLCDIASIPLADIYFITTSDQAIAEVVRQLALNNKIQSGTTLVHCSGLYSVDVLQDGLSCGARLLSVHPILSFAAPEVAIHDVAGISCGYEGDKEAMALVGPLFEAIGAKLFPLNQEYKTYYHVGLVMASNCAVGLIDAATKCLEKASVPADEALDIAVALMQQSLENIKRLGSTKSALTGPIARGDVDVVKHHLSQLKEPDRSFYLVLAQQLARLAKNPDICRELL